MAETFAETEVKCVIIDLTPETAQSLNVAAGSRVILSVSGDNIAAEILPPATPEIKANVQRLLSKYRATYEEMKRLGD